MSEALAGRRAVVAGASRGIGLACAAALAADGARVAMLARSADRLSAEALRIGGGALAVPCDVTSPEDVSRATQTVESAFGGSPEILVCASGVFTLARVSKTSPADFAAALAGNLTAPFLLMRAIIPGMRAAESGRIVVIGSVADRAILPENGAYSASKFGLRALVEVLREELRGSGVTATLVSPGATDTPLWDPISPDARKGFTPRSRMLRADSVADAVRWVITRPSNVSVDELRLSST